MDKREEGKKETHSAKMEEIWGDTEEAVEVKACQAEMVADIHNYLEHEDLRTGELVTLRVPRTEAESLWRSRATPPPQACLLGRGGGGGRRRGNREISSVYGIEGGE